MAWKWTPESNKKREATLKEKYGPDYRKRIAALGGSKRTRGNFGHLKDTNPEKLKEIQFKGGEKTARQTRKTPVKPQDRVRGSGKEVGEDETW